MKRPFDTYVCRRKTIEVPEAASFEVPSGLHRIAKIEIHGRSTSGCWHSLDIRDRHRDGGSTSKYWFQQDPVTHRCTAKHLLPIVAAVLAERYPKNHVGDLEGTITMTREHARIEDVSAFLISQLPPYLTPTRVDIYHYARADYRGEVFDLDGKHRAFW